MSSSTKPESNNHNPAGKVSNNTTSIRGQDLEILAVEEDVSLECKVEIFNISAIDTQSNTYTAGMYIQIRSDELDLKKMEALDVEIQNLQSTDREKSYHSEEEITPPPSSSSVGGKSMKQVQKHIIVYGTWTANFKFSAFPLDVQTLTVQLEC